MFYIMQQTKVAEGENQILDSPHWFDFHFCCSILFSCRFRLSCNQQIPHFFTMFIAKNNFPILHFMSPLPRLTKQVLSFSIQYLYHMLVKFEQNRMVRYKIFSFLAKLVNHFRERVDTILEGVSIIKTIIRY